MARPEFSPEYWYLAFFSDGFRIWKESFFISLNRERGVGERAERERERWGERWGERGGGGGRGRRESRFPPERNKTAARQLSSCLQHYRSHRSSWGPRTTSLVASWQRTHTHLLPPGCNRRERERARQSNIEDSIIEYICCVHWVGLTVQCMSKVNTSHITSLHLPLLTLV